MEEKRMPARYRMDETGQMRRTWNGKLPEEFNEKDMLLFAIDTDLTLNGRVSADTLDAVRKAGYSYERIGEPACFCKCNDRRLFCCQWNPCHEQ